MSLLSVTVKKARFVCEDAEQFNSYVTLKLQNVKSTTVTVKGANPCWEQDFLFETNDMNAGLLVEVWCKGFLWDRFLGYYYIPLSEVSYMNEVTRNQCNLSRNEAQRQAESHTSSDMRDTNSNTQQDVIGDTETTGQWVGLNLELEMRGTEVVGTKKPTGHSLLIDCRLELPYGNKRVQRTGWKALLTSETAMQLRAARPMCGSDPENTETADLQRKLEMLNNMMDQEARAEQARRQILFNIGHSGYSEDSDYTSDLNFPIGGQGANSSASQFRTAANQLATPQRSLETSRENSYERDDHQIPVTVGGRLAPGNYGSYSGSGHSPRYDEPYPEEGLPQRYLQSQHPTESSEPLFYNSRPKHYKEYRRRKHTWDYEDSQDGWYNESYDYHDVTKVDDTRIYSETEYCTNSSSTRRARGGKAVPYRRPSLERQMTLYDDHSYYADGYSNDGRVGKMSATYPECETDIRYNEYYDTITGYVYQDERYGQDDEDRQWDSGGKWCSGTTSTYYENKRNRKTLPQRPASSIGIHRPDYRPAVTRQRSYESEELDYNSHSARRRKLLQPQQRPMSRQEGTGKKLPPTPTKPSNVVIGRKLASLPATPSRQLPKTTRTPSEESYYKSDYNEDYNYAYRSQDNLPQDMYTESIYGQQGSAGCGVEQQPVQQQQQQQQQQHVANKAHYPEISQVNQYVTDYAATTQVDDQYGHSYPEQQHAQQNSYGQQTYAQQNSYKDEYQQQPYAQQNTQVYQEPYQDTTYPTVASQANDQYTGSQPKSQYDKPDGMIIEDNYHEMGFNQNNVQYQQDYKQDVYQEQYDDYSAVTVSSSSVYEQNNITNTYNQYQSEQYDSQYNINTSTDYHQKTYQETYNQVPVTSQENYQESYTKQPEDFVDYQTPYSKQSDVPTTYKNNYQESYEDYQELYDEYPDSYQGSFEEQQRYKDSSATTTTTTTATVAADRRQSEVPELSVTTPKGQTRTNGYPSNKSEYFYQSQENEDTPPLVTSRRKRLGKREASPLLQQNTDSLESRDDDLKDSFETAVSSIGSSQLKKGYAEYSTASGSPAPVASADSPQSISQIPQTTMVNHVTMANHVSSSMTVTAIVHANTANGKRLARADSYQEDVIEDDEEYIPEIIPKERKDSQMSHHSQLSQHSSTHSQKPKLLRGDSYGSDNFPEEYSRRDSYAQLSRKDSFSSTQDGFKPPLIRTDSYQQRELRAGSYGQNFTAPQPISRAESYQRGHFKDQESIDQSDIVLSNAVNGDYQMRDETLERYERGEEALLRNSREDSLVEPYKATPPLSHIDSPRGSITKQASLEESVQMDTPPRSPPEPTPDEELLKMVGAAPVPTQLKERPGMTARQRWHWAFNQIILIGMNVSTMTLSFSPIIPSVRYAGFRRSQVSLILAQCSAFKRTCHVEASV
ncbi:uncharacterized protein LOC105181693 [Harpegnathos saltator]|uniref:uncharacterized protein LOC105181693 n=1 Tax=Harpegnathos saltator TaxID=610380 RepID=UPI000DBEDC2B|nr:uncharacterized protein LOC105181693 [Harpegnathos saltator]